MKYNLSVYHFLRPWLGWIDKLAVLKQEPYERVTVDHQEVLIVGGDRVGRTLVESLRAKGVSFLVVDSNPDVIDGLRQDGVPCIFGDVTSSEVLDQIGFDGIKTVFSTIPDIRDNGLLIEHVKRRKPEANFVGIANSRGYAEALYKNGAHFVIVTYMIAAEYLGFSKKDTDNQPAVNLDALLEPGEELRNKGASHRQRLFPSK